MNRSLNTRQQRLAMAKVTRANENIGGNRGWDEAMPAAPSDTEAISE